MWNRAENQIELVLLRHGETEANREGRYLGQTDEALSGEGRKSLLSYKEQGMYPSVQYLFSSPMRRCLETAEILYPDLQPVVISEWREIDFGQFEYKNYEELKSNAAYQSWIESNGKLPFPGGESRKDFSARCVKGFVEMCSELGQKTGQYKTEPLRGGLIVHGGTIMALLSQYGKGNYFDYQCDNGRGYRCRLRGLGGEIQITEIKEL